MDGQRIAIIYHTVEGQTATVAEHIRRRAEAHGFRADLFPAGEAPGSFAGYAAVILGGSVHMRHHAPELKEFVERREAELSAIPSALFSVSLTATKEDEEHQAAAMAIVSEFIQQTGWHPDAVALVGGALKYTRYGFIKKRLMRHISAREGGPTDMSRDFELTDWEAVDEFTDGFLAHVREGAGAPSPV